MKKILVCLSLLVPSVGFCCPTLEGTWSSSLEKFESFNKRWANVEDKAWSFMTQTQGYEVITYKDNNAMTISSAAMEIKIGDKKMQRPASKEQLDFNVLGCTAKSMVLKFERNGKEQIAQLFFESADTYWTYMGTAEGSGNSHIREYYTKKQ
ncbi:hypothetical protein AADZ86_06895 [Colwelliaceae bacterium BS250]